MAGSIGDNGQLKSIIERAERLNEDLAALNTDKSELFKEARSNGFDTKALKRVIALRRIDKPTRDEFETLVDLYLSAVGEG